MLRKDAHWDWTCNHANSYQKIKENFLKSVCLNHIIPNAPFKVQCDGSLIGIGGVLYQLDENGHHCIVSVASRCLTSEEKRYTTTEIELLAIVYCVTKFRFYLIGTRFNIVTDHKGLTFMSSTVYSNSRLIRWTLLLYIFNIEYCKDVDNVIADFLSRNPNGKFSKEQNDKLLLGLLNGFSLPQLGEEASPLVILAIHNNNVSLKNILENLNIEQNNDKICHNIIENLNQNTNTGLSKNFQLYQNTLFYRENESNIYRIVIPLSSKQNLIDHTHDKLGHSSVFKTLSYVKRFYYWRGLDRDIKKFVLSCDLCQRVKYISVSMEGPYNLVAAEKPSDLVTVDFYGPFPRARGGVFVRST